MKIKNILLIPLILFINSCNKPEPVPPTDSFYPSVSNSEMTSIQESSISSEESSISSEESSTESIESVENTIVEKEIVLDFEDVPANQSGSYVADNEYEVEDYTFFYSSIMQNSGKFDSNVIQMKKEVGYIQNVDALPSELTITIMKNSFYDYSVGANVSAAIVPTVYAGNQIDELNEILSSTLIEETDKTLTYKFEESINYSYLKIINESSYAQYIVNITFKTYICI